MHTLSIDEIEALASHHGACKSEVERFLGTLYTTQALEKFPNAQDGGVVTDLIGYALDKDMIKAAVLVRKYDDGNSYLQIVDDPRQLVDFAGSIYFMVDYAEQRKLVKKALGEYKKIGIVATPCQLKSLTFGTNRTYPSQIYLKIGLFCMGSFDYDKFWNHVNSTLSKGRLQINVKDRPYLFHPKFHLPINWVLHQGLLEAIMH